MEKFRKILPIIISIMFIGFSIRSWIIKKLIKIGLLRVNKI